MASQSFQDQVKGALAVHKQAVLGIAENGIWRKNQREYPKANSSFNRHEKTIRQCAREPFRSHVRILNLEDILVSLQSHPSSTGLQKRALDELGRKYFASDAG